MMTRIVLFILVLNTTNDNMADMIKIEINKSKDFRQIYAIGALGGHTPYDFRISFYNDSPKIFSERNELQAIERTIETQVILSPAAAKELANWLVAHINDYETMFGQISQPKAAEKPKKSETTSQIQGYM